MVRDLAALCKQETLNWDEWGRMTAAYEGSTGPDYDQLIDARGGVHDLPHGRLRRGRQ
ncbi:hypothetical protein ACGFNV_37310 [Streptomyces sp. NPDC048751]|uniref:hypothetical protein n=1 Tax=Streptomyces sp. NPDC048751 TaxID=3365591 RepID=UPI003716870D